MRNIASFNMMRALATLLLLAAAASSALGQSCLDYENHLHRLGSVICPGVANDVVLYGDYAYLSKFYGGTEIIDVSYPDAPFIAGHLSDNNGDWTLELREHYLFVGAQTPDFEVFDISDPLSPVSLASLTLDGDVRGLCLNGNHAYAVAGNDGLKVLDIVDPADPLHIASLGLSGYAVDVATAWDLAFIAHSNYDMQIIDVSDPANPLPSGLGPIEGIFHAVTALGDYVYAAGNDLKIIGQDGMGGLEIVGGIDPTGYTIESVFVDGDIAYLGAGPAMITIDVSDPTDPIQVGWALVSEEANAVTKVGDLVYVASGYSYEEEETGRLDIFDAWSPANAEFLGEVDTDNWAYAVELQGETAYMTDGYGGLLSIDIADPYNPVIIDELDLGGLARTLALMGNLAYVTMGNDGFRIVDLDTFSDIGGMGSGDDTRHIAVRQDVFAFTAENGAGLRIYHVGNPNMPFLVGSAAIAGDVTRLLLMGNYVYVSIEGVGIGIVNVIYPTDPYLANILPLDIAPRDFCLDGNIVYATCGEDGLLVLDASNVAAPTVIGSLHLDDCTRFVEVEGDIAYVSAVYGRPEYVSGVYIVDVGDPSEPRRLGNIDTSSWVHDLSVAGDHIYVCDIYGGLDIGGTQCNQTAVEEGDGVPSPMMKLAAHPNPFNPHTTLRFSLDRPQHIRLSIYDVGGRQLVELANRRCEQGDYAVAWRGRDAHGHSLPSGIYFARLEMEDGNGAFKLVLLR